MPDKTIVDYDKKSDWVEEHPGRPTASHGGKLIACPVDWLMTLPGLRGEHKVLRLNMGKIQALSHLVDSKSWQRDHPVELGVQHDGQVYVDDGNHRIRGAHVAGIKTYLCKIKYYGGGEDNFDLAKTIAKYAMQEWSQMNVKTLIAQAKSALERGEDISSFSAQLIKIADEQGIGGSTDLLGQPGDQEYDAQESQGVDYTSPNNPDAGKTQRFGPQRSEEDMRDNENDMVQEASSFSPDYMAPTNSEELKTQQQWSMPGVPIGKTPGNRSDNLPKYHPTTPSPLATPGFDVPPLARKVNNPEKNYFNQDTNLLNSGGDKVDEGREEMRFTPFNESEMRDITNPQKNKLIRLNKKEELADGECAHCHSTTNDIRGHCCDKCAFDKKASANKPCAKCGMPTDKCVCIDISQPSPGNEPPKTIKVDPAMDPTKRSAAEEAVIDLIKIQAEMNRVASHMDEIEIPFSDLKLENGINYHLSGRAQELNMLAVRYLRTHVYPGNLRFTIARIEQTMNKLFVQCVVFDNQIGHTSSNVTNDNSLHKVSNVDNNKLQKTAWKKRLTEPLGENDKTGLVSCPVDSHFLVRACGTCPLAGNPETYITDGYVQCNFDNMSDWLQNGKQVREHRRWTER